MSLLLQIVNAERARKLNSPLVTTTSGRPFVPGRLASVLAGVLAGSLLLATPAGPARAENHRRAAVELTSGYRDKLGELADWCDGQGLADEARQTRRWLAAGDPNKLYVAVLTKEVGSLEAPPDAPEPVVQWHHKFKRLRLQQAQGLNELARRAVQSGRASLAFELVLAALREDPDHEAIRRLFGFQQFEGNWRTVYEIGRLRDGRVWHEAFGWIPKSYVSRYEEGQRYYRRRWISAAEDARVHRDIRTGWNVETEHYTIRTNHSIEAGVELGRKLETLYRVWRQLFIRYFASEAQINSLFSGASRGRNLPSPRYQVVYFRDRDNYYRALRPSFPNIEITTGVYVQGTRRAYFFAGEDSDERNLYHEATHQLFHESRPVAPGVTRQGNFWIIEGIATYMESLEQEDGFHVLGGFDDLRMKAARVRLLNDHFYIPLVELIAYDMEKLQSDPRVRTIYSQAAGLTHFLIHHDGGRYRDALVAYLLAVYNGRADANTLAQLTGTTCANLDRQYRLFLEAGP